MEQARNALMKRTEVEARVKVIRLIVKGVTDRQELFIETMKKVKNPMYLGLCKYADVSIDIIEELVKSIIEEETKQ